MDKADFGSSEAASRGGKARARALTREERSEQARHAVAVRWERAGKGALIRATHGSEDHPLRIENVEIPCYVLENGIRVLSQRGMQTGIGMSESGGAQRMLDFVASLRISDEETSNLTARILNPIRFMPPRGGTPANGYEATLLADLCDAVLEARSAHKKLTAFQLRVADQCELLVRGFARVGIIALVDEATGYQETRARDALAKILEAFVAKELKKWVRRFDPDYFRELCRLRKWQFKESYQLPRVAGKYTDDLVYQRLAPGVRDELQRLNPVMETGKRRVKHHQWLTEDVGHPKLGQHISSLIVLMRVSEDWESFQVLVNKALPRQVALPLLDPPPQEEESTASS